MLLSRECLRKKRIIIKTILENTDVDNARHILMVVVNLTQNYVVRIRQIKRPRVVRVTTIINKGKGRLEKSCWWQFGGLHNTLAESAFRHDDIKWLWYNIIKRREENSREFIFAISPVDNVQMSALAHKTDSKTTQRCFLPPTTLLHYL